VLCAAVLSPGLTAQSTPSWLEGSLAPTDWSLPDPAAVRYGQLAVILVEGAPRLEVYQLSTSRPPSFAGRGAGHAPAFTGNAMVVAEFSTENQNALGGFFNTFQRSPSNALAALGSTSDGRRALQLSFDRRAEGFCGAWIHLFDYRDPPDQRRYLDAGGMATISFWVRGDQGGEEILLKVADDVWEAREDAVPIGEIGRFVPGGRIETEWQQAVVPLDALPGDLDRSRLASLIFEAASPGQSRISVARLALSREQGPLPPLPDPAPSAPSRKLSTATWVWNTSSLAGDPVAQQELVDFVVRQNFDVVYLQLPGLPGETGAVGEQVRWDMESLRPVVASLHRAGARVLALDGYRTYALPEMHGRVLENLDSVIRYNRESAQDERFHGIHFDIEPYLIPGFHGPRREMILSAFLDLFAEMKRRSSAAGLTLGADIPFWYDAPGEQSYEMVTVQYGGERKPVSQHVIDLADEVTLMDYRTVSYGADGTIRHAEGEIEYAGSVGTPVLVGLETGPLPDEVLLEFRGEPARGLPDTLPPGDVVLMAPVADSIGLFVVSASWSGPASETPAAGPSGLEARIDPRALAAALAQKGVDPGHVLWWKIDRRIHVPADKITFDRLGTSRLTAVMRETAEAFAGAPAFAGFAIHYFRSYREMLERP
jgi:hypothetical protein